MRTGEERDFNTKEKGKVIAAKCIPLVETTVLRQTPLERSYLYPEIATSLSLSYSLDVRSHGTLEKNFAQL